MAARLNFRSTYRGVAQFDVLSGAMAGMCVKAHYASREFYAADYSVAGVWTLTPEEYAQQIVSAAGLVTCGTGPVTADVLEAIQAEVAAGELVNESQADEVYRTGRLVDGQGWVVECQAAAASI